MKKLRWLKQETTYSCSVACLRMVMDYYGTKVTEAELRRKCKTKPAVGTHPISLIETAQSYNLDAQLVNPTFDELKVYLEKGVPVIVS